MDATVRDDRRVKLVKLVATCVKGAIQWILQHRQSSFHF